MHQMHRHVSDAHALAALPHIHMLAADSNHAQERVFGRMLCLDAMAPKV